jgi:short-subunit dehydrogenase
MSHLSVSLFRAWNALRLMLEAMPERKGTVVVVTGASAGVGRATVREFARRGTRLGLIARDEERLRATQAEIESMGGSALALPADVADAGAVEAAAERVQQELGPIDTWVNNAMTSVFAAVRDITAEEFRRVTEVTYLGQVYGTLAALKRMLPRDHGTIVQVGSALAYRGIPLQAAYCGAKHGVQGFTESLRSELLHDRSNVRLTMVNLPALNTPQFEWVKSKLPRKPQPVPPIYQPEVAADAIVWAAENAPREINVGLPTIITVNGNKIAPALGDRYLASSGYDSQQSDQPDDPDRPDNLWAPVPGDFEAHGRFGEQAREHSIELTIAKHARAVAAGVALGITAAAMGGVTLARRLRDSRNGNGRDPEA